MDAATVKATKIFQRIFPDPDRYPVTIFATLITLIINTSENNLDKAQQVLKMCYAVINELKGGNENVCSTPADNRRANTAGDMAVTD